MRIRKYHEGYVIHGPDTPSFSFHTIMSGRVRFANISEDGDVLELFVMEPTQSFGDISLFSGLTPPHMAIVDVPSKIGTIGEKNFRALLAQDDLVRDWVLWRLSHRLSEAYLMLDGIRSQAPRERILRYLTWLVSNGFGKGAAYNTVEITQTQLASRLGLSRSTTSSVLKGLEKAGRLKCQYRAIEMYHKE